MKILTTAALTIVISMAACSNQKKAEQNKETVETQATTELSTMDKVKQELASQGFTTEFHELLGVFNVKDESGNGTLELNPDGDLSFTIIRKGKNLSQDEKIFKDVVVSNIEPLGFSNKGAGKDGSDCYFKKTIQEEVTEGQIEQALRGSGYTAEYSGLLGGGYLTVEAKDSVASKNGRTRINIGSIETISLFSQGKDKAFEDDVIKAITNLGYEDTGKGDDGSDHLFKLKD